MGRAIEEIALKKGHEIVLRSLLITWKTIRGRIYRRPMWPLSSPAPKAPMRILPCACRPGSGSLWLYGWLDRYEEIRQLCLAENQAFLYASNFSVGVNIFFEVNKRLAELMPLTRIMK